MKSLQATKPVYELAVSDEVAAWEKLNSLTQGSPESNEAAAYLQLKVENFDEAESFAKKRKEQMPPNPQMDLYLGDIAFWRGKLPQALEFYNSFAKTAGESSKSLIEQRINSTQQSLIYVENVKSAKQLSLSLGAATLIFLILCSWVLPLFLFRNKNSAG